MPVILFDRPKIVSDIPVYQVEQQSARNLLKLKLKKKKREKRVYVEYGWLVL